MCCSLLSSRFCFGGRKKKKTPTRHENKRILFNLSLLVTQNRLKTYTKFVDHFLRYLFLTFNAHTNTRTRHQTPSDNAYYGGECISSSFWKCVRVHQTIRRDNCWRATDDDAFLVSVTHTTAGAICSSLVRS